MIIYLALSIYIFSLLSALLLFITGKNRSNRWLIGIGAVHFIFLLCFIYYLIARQAGHSFPLLQYSFLAFICSGVFTAGIALRAKVSRIMKIYFSVFLLSIFYFLLSPSRFTNFILYMNPKSTSGKSFSLIKNYYLEPQRSFSTAASSIKKYKLIQKYGLFYKTLQRDIELNGEPDSVLVRRWNDQVAVLTAYYHSDSTHQDSMVLNISLIHESDISIEKR